MEIFKEIEAPQRHHAFSSAHKVRWLTWSDDFLSFVPQVRKVAQNYGQPEFVHFKKYKLYNYTYTVDPGRLDAGFEDEAMAFTRRLSAFRIGKSLNFFDGLIPAKLGGTAFHFLIALFRRQLAELKKDNMHSLYAPLTVTPSEDDFPLHCDLYIPQYLWNVYEETAPGREGASTFLPVDILLDRLAVQVKSLPGRKREQLRKLIRVENYKDRYDALFALLYGVENSWSAELKDRMHKECLQIKFAKGQGYMIHDRSWLHGRTRTFGHVTAKRLHRLIF